MMKLSRLAVCGLILSLALPAAAMDAFEVAGHAPKDALMVLSWVGADQAKADFEKTHMGELYNEPEVNAFLTTPTRSLWQALMQEIGKDGNEKQAQAIEGLLAQLWKRPGFICVLDVKPTDKAPSTLAVAAEWMVDDPDNALRDLFKEWMKQSLGDDIEEVKYGNTTYRRLSNEAPLYLAIRKRTWILALGDQAAIAMAKKRSGSRSFLAGKQHKRAAAALGDVKEPWLYCSLNTERLIKRALDDSLKMAQWMTSEAKPEDRVMSAMVYPLATGSAVSLFAGMFAMNPAMFGSGECAAALGSDGKMLTATTYAIPAKDRTWLFDYFFDKPVDVTRLKEVPASAESFMLCSIDAKKMFEETIDTVQAYGQDINERNGLNDQIPDLRALIHGSIGVSLTDELFAHLGHQVLAYSANGGADSVLVIDIKSREAIEGVLTQTLQKLSRQVTFRTEDAENARMFHLSLGGGAANLGPVGPMLGAMQPTIGVTDDRVILAAAPGAVKQYLKQLGESVNGDVKHPGAKEFLDAHKDAQLGMISWQDEAKAFTQTYQAMAGAMVMAQMARQQLPFDVSFAQLPPPAVFTRHMDQAMVWVELKNGMRIRHGELGVSIPTGAMTAGGAALGVSIALPAIARARELAKRTVCTANMRGIGQACYIYAKDHDGKFPPDIVTMISENLTTSKQFVCPSSTATVGELHACYEYIPGITTNDAPTLVVMYEINNPHQGEGGNVLFQDGHVEFVKPYSRVLELVEETKQKIAEAKKAA